MEFSRKLASENPSTKNNSQILSAITECELSEVEKKKLLRGIPTMWELFLMEDKFPPLIRDQQEINSVAGHYF